MEFDRMNVKQIKESIRSKLETNFGCEVSDATREQLYQAVALTVRDEVMQRRTASRGERKLQHAKKLYYLSAEFLVGRALHSNMVNLVNEKAYLQALEEMHIDKDVIFEEEPEPGLGNGGLGRLAACFLDALTSMDLPAMGCTIRYEYGLFRQKLVDGYQVEVPFLRFQVGELHCRIEGNFLLIHHIPDFGNQFGEADKSPHSIFTYPRIFSYTLNR